MCPPKMPPSIKGVYDISAIESSSEGDQLDIDTTDLPPPPPPPYEYPGWLVSEEERRAILQALQEEADYASVYRVLYGDTEQTDVATGLQDNNVVEIDTSATEGPTTASEIFGSMSEEDTSSDISVETVSISGSSTGRVCDLSDQDINAANSNDKTHNLAKFEYADFRYKESKKLGINQPDPDNTKSKQPDSKDSDVDDLDSSDSSSRRRNEALHNARVVRYQRRAAKKRSVYDAGTSATSSAESVTAAVPEKVIEEKQFRDAVYEAIKIAVEHAVQETDLVNTLTTPIGDFEFVPEEGIENCIMPEQCATTSFVEDQQEASLIANMLANDDSSTCSDDFITVPEAGSDDEIPDALKPWWLSTIGQPSWVVAPSAPTSSNYTQTISSITQNVCAQNTQVVPSTSFNDIQSIPSVIQKQDIYTDTHVLPNQVEEYRSDGYQSCNDANLGSTLDGTIVEMFRQLHYSVDTAVKQRRARRSKGKQNQRKKVIVEACDSRPTRVVNGKKKVGTVAKKKKVVVEISDSGAQRVETQRKVTESAGGDHPNRANVENQRNKVTESAGSDRPKEAVVIEHQTRSRTRSQREKRRRSESSLSDDRSFY